MAMSNPQDMVEEDAADLQFPKGGFLKFYSFVYILAERFPGALGYTDMDMAYRLSPLYRV